MMMMKGRFIKIVSYDTNHGGSVRTRLLINEDMYNFFENNLGWVILLKTLFRTKLPPTSTI